MLDYENEMLRDWWAELAFLAVIGEADHDGFVLNEDVCAVATILARNWRQTENLSVQISPGYLAEATNLSEEVVDNVLLRLEALGLITFLPAPTATDERIYSPTLPEADDVEHGLATLTELAQAETKVEEPA